jgi:hypothetical protein
MTGAVFRDLKKAFDTVHHGTLLSKLKTFGIHGAALEWFGSYLEGRSQYTMLNQTKSSTRPIQYGVPQGSILGPLLFVMYINDLPDTIKSKVVMYADDTAIFSSARGQSDIEKELNDDLRTLSDWLRDNKLTLNLTKTKSMWFYSRGRSNKTTPLIFMYGK